MTSTANLSLFQLNYKTCEGFIGELGSALDPRKGGQLLDMFNLATYGEFVAMELADRQTSILRLTFPEQQSKPEGEEEKMVKECKLADETIRFCLMPLQAEHYYLPRVGDKLIKLSI